MTVKWTLKEKKGDGERNININKEKEIKMKKRLKGKEGCKERKIKGKGR